MTAEPTFDKHGYPTDETLETIHQWREPWSATVDQALAGCLDYVRAAWRWPENVQLLTAPDGETCEVLMARLEDGDRYMRFATGGWSGNESLMAALKGNVLARGLWRVSAYGGLHIYRYPTDDAVAVDDAASSDASARPAQSGAREVPK